MEVAIDLDPPGGSLPVRWQCRACGDSEAGGSRGNSPQRLGYPGTLKPGTLKPWELGSLRALRSWVDGQMNPAREVGRTDGCALLLHPIFRPQTGQPVFRFPVLREVGKERLAIGSNFGTKLRVFQPGRSQSPDMEGGWGKPV